MADRTFVEENQAARQELADLIAHLDERSLHCAVGPGWTVSSLLCHLAFWDRMALSVLPEWERGGVEPPRLSARQIDAINAAVRAISLAVPGSEAARLALDNATAVDSLVEGISGELCSQIVSAGFERLLRRSLHRRGHLQRIKESLG